MYKGCRDCHHWQKRRENDPHDFGYCKLHGGIKKQGMDLKCSQFEEKKKG